jgi:hypothetical protein
VGAGSCAAAACHNGNFAHGGTGSEYTNWITRDPHAKAYEVLFADAAKGMQKHLKSPAPAHEDRRCLQCHVAPGYDAAKHPSYFPTDGVSCESCHGPAQKWLNLHHLDAWQSLDRAAKKALGMNDTRSLSGRAQACTPCHVGTAGADVDHDLIAAGHPRLHFEFAAFHSYLPRHWPDAKDRDPAQSERGHADFEARAWLVGQLATAHAALRLLADRAGDNEKPWPEFAEFDCASCHHDLQFPSARQKTGYGKRKAGALPWGHYTALSPLALEALNDPRTKDARVAMLELQKIMDAGNPQPEVIAKNATKAAVLLQAALAATDDRPISVDDTLRNLLGETRARASARDDESVQLHLGLSALHFALFDMKRPVSEELRSSLLHVGVRKFDPQPLRKRFEESCK